MNFYNLKHKEEQLNFKEATIKGQGKDKGLFFPEDISKFSNEFLQNLPNLSNEEIAFQVMKDFAGDEIPEAELRKIVAETIAFEIPLKKVTENISVLELFHGPTLAFKDVGARFMSRCLGYFLKNETRKVTVLVATSGDTGGAVANGFYDVEGIEVVILYPKNRVSAVQEKQLTALGKNIHALEVNGSFDDCQALVKQAFSDESLNEKLLLTSANSINVARWLPQQIYYVLALKQWLKNNSENPVICVPSGNFGNICAGILAHHRGLPVEHFIAACNVNDVVPEYLRTEILQPKETVATISNAMDVGDPSNFVRILELFDKEFNQVKNKLSGYTIDDEETLKTIERVEKDYGYVLDPHGAVAFVALEKYLAENGGKGFFLETAHPVKFPDSVEKATGKSVEIPKSLEELMRQEKFTTEINPQYEELKEFLLKK